MQALDSSTIAITAIGRRREARSMARRHQRGESCRLERSRRTSDAGLPAAMRSFARFRMTEGYSSAVRLVLALLWFFGLAA